MVLVDTSVWVRFLADRAPYAAELDRLLASGEVVGHEFVYGELLVGDAGGRKQLLADHALMRQAPRVAHAEVVEFVRHHRLHGKGIGWIDVHLLASALIAGARLWTADASLSAAARQVGIRYDADLV
jgi:predicted nucleic acid-binding protein